MKNILTILKKELLRVFMDRRLIITLILPGIILYAMYSFMGDAFNTSDVNDQQAQYKIIAVNLPVEVKQVLESDELELNASYTYLYTNTQEETAQIINEKKDMLKNKEADIILVFDKDFSDIVNSNSGDKPAVAVFYNPSEGTSGYAFQKVSLALEIYRNVQLEIRNIDAGIFYQSIEQVYDEKAAAAKGFAMLIPLLIITFLFSGCMALAPDSIAGEKERGTIATILITPIKRSQLALGKILALSILACISALSSFVGLIFSLPKLLGGVSLAGIYGLSEYLLILLVLLSTVLLIIGLMSILSSLAKSVKEASMLIMPFMFISMLAGITSMISGTAAASPVFYFIPIYSSVQALVSILTFDVNVLNLVITFASNMLYLLACVFGLTKLFNSEKVMFSK